MEATGNFNGYTISINKPQIDGSLNKFQLIDISDIHERYIERDTSYPISA